MTAEIRVLRAGDKAALDRVALDTFDDPIVPTAARAFLADPGHPPARSQSPRQPVPL